MPRLPSDCRVEFHPRFLTSAEEDALFAWLDAIPELKDRRVRTADGQEHVTETGAYLIADAELLDFRHIAEPFGARCAWPDLLLPIKARAEALAGRAFRVGRCIYYEDGTRGVDYHQDLPAYGDTSVIASLSLGEERTFSLRSIEDPEQRYDMLLPSGSLVVLGEGCQERYQHALLPDPEKTGVRFNLTFRMFGWEG